MKGILHYGFYLSPQIIQSPYKVCKERDAFKVYAIAQKGKGRIRYAFLSWLEHNSRDVQGL